MTVAAIADAESVSGLPVEPVRGRALARWRRNRAVELAMAGHSYDDIAEQVGYSNRGTAWHAVQDALKETTARNVEQYRSLTHIRYEALLAAHWDAATVGGNVRSAELVLKIIAAEVRLLGLGQTDTAASEGHSVIVGGTSEEYIAALKALTGGRGV